MSNKNMSADIYQGLFWILLAIIGYGVTFAFNEEITNYRYGAAAWPRVLLFSLFLLGCLQIFNSLRKNKLTFAIGFTGGDCKENTKPFPLLYFSIIIAYAYFLSRTGFYITTPAFILLFLFSMGLRDIKKILLVSLIVYSLLLLVFVRLLYLPLPTGSWGLFYEANNWLLSFIRS